MDTLEFGSESQARFAITMYISFVMGLLHLAIVSSRSHVFMSFEVMFSLSERSAGIEKTQYSKSLLILSVYPCTVFDQGFQSSIRFSMKQVETRTHLGSLPQGSGINFCLHHFKYWTVDIDTQGRMVDFPVCFPRDQDQGKCLLTSLFNPGMELDRTCFWWNWPDFYLFIGLRTSTSWCCLLSPTWRLVPVSVYSQDPKSWTIGWVIGPLPNHTDAPPLPIVGRPRPHTISLGTLLAMSVRLGVAQFSLRGEHLSHF